MQKTAAEQLLSMLPVPERLAAVSRNFFPLAVAPAVDGALPSAESITFGHLERLAHIRNIER